MGGQEPLSLHLREAPGLADPERDGLEPFLLSLLTPVRSGIILTRTDLARAATPSSSACGSASAGGRCARAEQDAAAMLEWLAGEASRWASRHATQFHLAAEPAAFWRDRAEATAQLLLRPRAGLG